MIAFWFPVSLRKKKKFSSLWCDSMVPTSTEDETTLPAKDICHGASKCDVTHGIMYANLTLRVHTLILWSLCTYTSNLQGRGNGGQVS